MGLVRSATQSGSQQPFQHIEEEEGQARRQPRAQCKVSAKTVDTFDGVAYRAPLSNCYTVLAKDCANREQPKFAVLMKSVGGGSGDDQKVSVE